MEIEDQRAQRHAFEVEGRENTKLETRGADRGKRYSETYFQRLETTGRCQKINRLVIEPFKHAHKPLD